jgi:hypothetical protein
MKALRAILGLGAVVVVLVSCAEPVPPPAVTTGRPYSVYATTSDIQGPVNSAYRNWTTAQLQQRRKDLYYMVPQTQNRKGIAEYIYHGGQLPQQDEIRAVEAELTRRYNAGDRTAYMEPVWPEVRRHPAG